MKTTKTSHSLIKSALLTTLALASSGYAQDTEIAKGEYGGRISGFSGHETNGYAFLKAGKLGAFTAKIQYAGFSYSLKGTLTTGSPVPLTTVNAGSAPQIEVTAAYDALLSEVVCTVRQLSQTSEVPFTLKKNPYSRTSPCPIAGSYTVGLNQPGGMPVSDVGTPHQFYPQYGYAVVNVTTAGIVKVKGAVPDTTKFSSSTIAADQDPLDSFPPAMPIYAGLHKVRGSVNGDLFLEQFGPTAPVVVFGDLQWHRPQQVTGPTQGPQIAQLYVNGAPYVKPAPGTPILTVPASSPNMRAEFFAGALPAPTAPGPWMELFGTLGNTPASGPYIMPLSGALGTPAEVKFNATTGLYSGKFTHPATGKSTRMAGAIVQYTLAFGENGYVKGDGFGPGNFLGTEVDPVTKKKTKVPGTVLLEVNSALPN